jgi:hypothetical protein
LTRLFHFEVRSETNLNVPLAQTLASLLTFCLSYPTLSDNELLSCKLYWRGCYCMSMLIPHSDLSRVEPIHEAQHTIPPTLLCSAEQSCTDSCQRNLARLSDTKALVLKEIQLLPALACISSRGMISTAQWLRATKSTFTPYEPAHRRSPEMALSPIESLRSREHGARKSHVRFNFQHNRQTPNHNAHRRNSHPAVFPQLTCCLERMASPFCCFQLPWPGVLPLTLI